jgi:hexosaminidase
VTPPRDLLIPVRRFTAGRGCFRWPAEAVLAGESEADVLPLAQLALDLHRLGIRTTIRIGGAGPATVRLRRQAAVAGREAYRLAISPAGVELTASADAGAYYAVQTLRDLLMPLLQGGATGGLSARVLFERHCPYEPWHPMSGSRTASLKTPPAATLPACTISDRPDFARRGVYLDCSRGKVPRVETLRALLEQLARWKLNELQLYVEDVFTWRRHPLIGRGSSPFTPNDLLALQEHGRRHHVRLVGSLASFGHMEHILALPRYRPLAEMPGYRGLPGGTTLCPGNAGSLRLVEDLYAEFVPLFEADDFNVCGDEPWELGQGRSLRRARKVGLGRVYLDFLLKLHRLCDKHGKRMNAWADIVLAHPEVLGDLPKDVVMLNWDYNPEGTRLPRTAEIARAGLAAMVCPGTGAWQSHGCRLEIGMRNIARFAAEGRACGAEGLLNTDWGDGGHRNMMAVSLHNYAYGAAHSWHTRGVRDRDFTERFCRNLFGEAGRAMADPIRTLGRAHEALRLPYRNDTPLYNILVGPLGSWTAPDDARAAVVDALRPADLSGHRRRLEALRWPAPKSVEEPIAQLALEEFPLAARLDRLACLRTEAIKKMRAGRAPRTADLRRLVTLTRKTSEELERVWLLGNRPSRLREQLGGLRRSVREYERMLRR